MFTNTRKNFRQKSLAIGVCALLAGVYWSVPLQAQEEGDAQSQSEREQFVKEIRRVENLNKKYTQEIQDVKDSMNQQQEDFNKRVNQLEEKLNKAQTVAPKEKAADPSQIINAQMEQQTYDILSRGAELNPNDESFKEELAKAHYNMGNIFFQRGEYQRAVVEYYQAVDLSPYDADIHFNLAFISSEYLKDQETALKHYQWYLYLKPEAEDIDLVKEKMAAAKLAIRSRIDSPLDKDRGFENVIR